MLRSPFRRRLRALRLLPLFVLLGSGPGEAHEPHQPVAAVAPVAPTAPAAPAAPTAPTAPAGPAAAAAAAIPLPAGWTESRVPAGAGAMAPALTADGDGFLATWIEPGGASAPGSQRVRVARFNGRSWTFPATVRESALLFANWADVPGVVRAADGALYAWWLERSGAGTYTYEVRLARSSDQGVTFAPLGVLHDDRSPAEHGFVAAVVEGKGVRLYYLDGRATPGDKPMQLRTVVVEGTQIGPSELVDESVCDCCSTAAVAIPGGSVVAYRDRTSGEIRDVRVALRPAVGAMTAKPVASDGWKIAGCPVNGPALAANGGDLAVAWFAAPGDRPRMAVTRSTDGGATWGPAEVIVSARPMGQLALAPLPSPAEGFALSWLEAIDGGAELRLTVVDGSGKPGAPLAIARTGAGRAAGIPRLAAAGNRLALLWLDAGGAGLRFASSGAGPASTVP